MDRDDRDERGRSSDPGRDDPTRPGPLRSNDRAVAGQTGRRSSAYQFGAWESHRLVRRRSPLKTVALAFGLAVAGFAVGILTGNLLALFVDFSSLSAVGQVLFVLVTLQGTAFPLVAVGYLRVRELPFSFLRIRRPSLWDLLVAVGGFVLAFVLVYLGFLVVSALGAPTASRADQQLLQNPQVLAVLIPLAIVVIGPGEELLFRGVIQGTLREQFGAPAAIVLASATFAPAHLLALTGSLQALAVSVSLLFLPSLAFGAVYEYTENLVVPALSHGLYNAVLFSLSLVAMGS